MISLEDAREAAAALRGVTLRTPLVRLLPHTADDRILLKAESLQRTGSFKLRGAFNAISVLAPSERPLGVVAHSSGNHGLGVAWAARLLDVPATIVMPDSAPGVKLDAVRAEGAEVVIVGPASTERAERAATIARDRGARLIPSADDAAVICG